MTAPIADLDAGFEVRSLLPNSIFFRIVVPIGASGATGTLLDAPNGVAVAKNTTGVYDVTGLPPCPSATSANSKAKFWYQLESPSLTVTECNTTTVHNTTNGTLSFTTTKAGTATEPASGNVITIFCVMERE